jgi:hypothetical protein
MKQIGARQEAGRIGGIGACGRELCCASWVSSFTSVTTGAARVQDLSLNPLKLAGQCSKLKCCLTYEYDVYADARRSMPRLREPLQAIDGEYFLVKSDILAHTMTFSTSKESLSNLVTIPVSRVREILAVNRNGGKVESILGEDFEPQIEEPTYRTEEDSITRFDKAKKRKKKNRNNRNNNQGGQNSQEGENTPSNQTTTNTPHTQGGNGENGARKHHHHHHRNHHHNNKPKQE